MSDKIKVLYISGSGRSGSTVLDRLMGQFPDTISIGEAVLVWEQGFLQNRLCSCGDPFLECSFWQAVEDRLKDEISPEDVEDLATFGRQTTSFRSIPSLNITPFRLRKLYSFYRAIRDVSGASLIVDSSKSAIYAYCLSMIPEIDLSVVHLVRDSRAVAFSLLRKKNLYPDSHGESYMARLSPWRSAIHWNLYNISADIIKMINRAKFFPLLRYEKFVSNPVQILEQIRSFAGTQSKVSPRLFLEDQVAFLKPGHGIAGNPMKFDTGNLKIELDREWLTSMHQGDKLLVTILTFPLLLKYGYLGK